MYSLFSLISLVIDEKRGISMLSNLFAGSIRADDNKAMLSTYLRTLKSEPSKLAKVLAALLIPAAALGWWYYSVAMSVDAVVPLNSTSSRTSDLPALEQQSSVESATDSSSSTATPLSSSSENIDVNISGNSPQTSVRIDGQSVPVPTDGSTHQVIQNDNGKTTVDINVNSNSSGTSSTRSSTKINLKSSSSSDVDIRSKEVQ